MKQRCLQGEVDRRYVVASVLKTLQALNLVCEASQPLSLNDLVVMAALPKTTVFRYLHTLRAMRMVEHETATDCYRAGLGVW